MVPQTVPNLDDVLVQIALAQASRILSVVPEEPEDREHRPLRCEYLSPLEWSEDGEPRWARRFAFRCSNLDCPLHRIPLWWVDYHDTEEAAEAAWSRAHCPELPVGAEEFTV